MFSLMEVEKTVMGLRARSRMGSSHAPFKAGETPSICLTRMSNSFQLFFIPKDKKT